MKLTIRRAIPADAGRVAAMLAELFAELAEGDETPAATLLGPVSELLLQKRGVVLMAELDGRAVGVMTLEPGFAVYAGGALGTIRELYVEPAQRSAGVGAQFVQAAVAYGREQGWRRIEVTAPSGDRWLRSVRFYDQNGFVAAGPKLKLPLTAP